MRIRKTESGVPQVRRMVRGSYAYAYVTLRRPDGSRRQVVLGPWGSGDVMSKFAAAVAANAQEHAAAPPAPPKPAQGTVGDLLAGWTTWAARHYCRPDGAPTGHIRNVLSVATKVAAIHGELPAVEFSPRRLIEVRDAWQRDGLARGTINSRVRWLIGAFSWGVEREHVPPHVVTALREVRPLERGRCSARETAPVTPPTEAEIDKALPFMPTEVATMIRLHRLIGCRGGELAAMRRSEIDTTSTPDVWLWQPTATKSMRKRRVPYVLGAAAQELLAPLLLGGDRVFRRTHDGYRRAVHRATRAAGLRWHPHALRHARATEVARIASLDEARAVIGHGDARTTAHYAKTAEVAKAIEFVRKHG